MKNTRFSDIECELLTAFLARSVAFTNGGQLLLGDPQECARDAACLSSDADLCAALKAELLKRRYVIQHTALDRHQFVAEPFTSDGSAQKITKGAVSELMAVALVVFEIQLERQRGGKVNG